MYCKFLAGIMQKKKDSVLNLAITLVSEYGVLGNGNKLHQQMECNKEIGRAHSVGIRAGKNIVVPATGQTLACLNFLQ